jgi:hypothetical protein
MNIPVEPDKFEFMLICVFNFSSHFLHILLKKSLFDNFEYIISSMSISLLLLFSLLLSFLLFSFLFSLLLCSLLFSLLFLLFILLLSLFLF